MIKKMKVKPIIFIFISLLLVGIGATYAIFQNNYTFANKFKSSSLNVKIDEDFEPTPWSNTPTTKKVDIVNEESSDVVIRINYDEVWSNGEIQISNLVNGENVVIKDWTDEFLSDFTLKDGWYYYNKVLKGNSRVSILKSIKLDEDLVSQSEDDYHLYNYQLSFNFEALQKDEEAIKKVWGLTATIVNDDITW